MFQRKRRTREHIIADLSVNHVERFVLLCGHTIEKISSDYGYDLILYTYSSEGELENGNVYIQVKATDNVRFISKGQAVSFPLKKRDLHTWLAEPLPVMLILYDAVRDCAYWLYIQEHFESVRDFDMRKVKKYHSVNIPVSNRVGKGSIRKFAKFKKNVLRQIYENKIRHHA